MKASIDFLSVIVIVVFSVGITTYCARLFFYCGSKNTSANVSFLFWASASDKLNKQPLQTSAIATVSADIFCASMFAPLQQFIS